MANEITEDNVDDRLKQFNTYLQRYREKFHLDKIKVEPVNISITIPKMKEMQPEELSECLLKWGYYVLAMQTEINSLRAELEWVDTTLTRYLGIHQKDVDREYGYTAADRKLLLLEDDAYANKLYELQRNINSRIKQLEFIPNSVSFLIKVGQQTMDHKWRERYAQS